VTTVVAVHGLWMLGASMALLSRRLEPLGFRMRAFGYRSVSDDLTTNAEALLRFLDELPDERVHLIGHSLGGVVIAAAVAQAQPARIGRAVLLGSPLRGSLTAKRLARFPGGRHFIGACLAELHARGGLTEWRAPVEVGSIAGDAGFGAGRLLGALPGPNDGTVAVAETQIDGLTDHVVLPVAHTALVWSKAVGEEVGHFLLHGRFRHGVRAGSVPR
jgi:pimeloyl-ACP methyl ester carboxylesterase